MILTLLGPLGQNYFQGPKLNVNKLEIVAEFVECLVSTNSLQLPRYYIPSVETRQTLSTVSLDINTTSSLHHKHVKTFITNVMSFWREKGRLQSTSEMAWRAWESGSQWPWLTVAMEGPSVLFFQLGRRRCKERSSRRDLKAVSSQIVQNLKNAFIIL